MTGLPPVPDAMRPRFLPEDRNTSAMLVNRSPHGIAAMQQIWTLQYADGRTSTGSIGPGANPSILLPFGLSEKVLKRLSYWNVILPGSKRYLNANGQQAGDNRDVRPPRPDELWNGGFGMAGGGGSRSYAAPLAKVTVSLDGLFFDDGGFLGPDQKGLWEQIVTSAELHLELAAIAKQMRQEEASLRGILDEIEAITGPATPPPPPRGVGFRQQALNRLAWTISTLRQQRGEEAAVDLVISWAEQRLPHFRRL